MKKLMTYSLLIAAAIASSAIFANRSVNVPFTDKDDDSGKFYCAVTGLETDDTSTISMQTHNVQLTGAHDGAYVPRIGTIEGLPVSVLNENYFQIKKTGSHKVLRVRVGGETGSVDVTLVTTNNNANLECHANETGGRTSIYGGNGTPG